MKAFYHFNDVERTTISKILRKVEANPYKDYSSFAKQVKSVSYDRELPPVLAEITQEIKHHRQSGDTNIHVLRNCPLDETIPELDNDDPVKSKYEKKKTFESETFLALFAELTGTPLLSYGSRNNGDFFTDVIAINRYSGQLTGFSDSELVYHNDRTAHDVRADYVTLLGMRCPDDDLVYTGYIDGRELLKHLSPGEQQALRKTQYVTHFDVFSRDTNVRQVVSAPHAVLENESSFRYLDTLTTYASDAPQAARDALFSLRNAIARAEKVRHRIRTGDLLAFANQDGLHNREKIEISDAAKIRSRWLLKTYAFRDESAADRHASRWIGGVRGRVAD